MKKVYAILATALLATLISGQVMGQTTYYSRANGNWSGAIWSTSTNGSAAVATITANDNVVIQNGNAVTVTSSVSCNDLTLKGGSSATDLTINSGVTLNVNGNVSLETPTGNGGNKRTRITYLGTLSAGSSINIATSADILGSGTGATIDYSASSGSQNVISGAYNNLTISGGAEKVASGPITVVRTLTLTSGILKTTSTNLLTLASTATSVSGGNNTSFINGPVSKLGLPKNSSYTLPIGSADAGGIRPATIYNTSNGSGDYTIELLRADPQSLGTTGVGTAAGPTALTRREYWDITSTRSFELTLDWNSRSSINSTVGLTIATFNSGSWTVEGTGSNRPASVSGTQLTKNSLTAGTNLKYAIASLQAGAAFPLPVTFGTIKAFEKGTGVQVDWTSYSELNIANYQVERSADGINFTSIGEVAPRNVTDATNYNFFDAMPLTGTSFYRIRNNDIDGKSGLSTIVKVNLNKNIKAINVYPNPVRGNRVSFQTSDLAKGLYNVEVYNTMGSRLFSQAVNHAGGAITQTLSLPTLQSGQYTLRINGTSSSSIHKITILQ